MSGPGSLVQTFNRLFSATCPTIFRTGRSVCRSSNPWNPCQSVKPPAREDAGRRKQRTKGICSACTATRGALRKIPFFLSMSSRSTGPARIRSLQSTVSCVSPTAVVAQANLALLHRDRLRQIPRLIHITSTLDGDVIRQQLQRHRRKNRREQIDRLRNPELVIQLARQ